MKKRILSYGALTLMALLMALTYEILVFQNSFAPAGLNGIATMIQYKLNFSVGYMSLLINVPLCIIAFFMVDRDYALKSFYFTLLFSLFLLLFKQGLPDLSRFYYKTQFSTVLAPALAGIINGFVYGIVIRNNGSTGGTQIVASCIHEKRPQANLLWVLFALNSLVAVVSYFVYDYQMEPVILCILYCFLTSKVSDMMLQGAKEQLKVEIVTDRPEELSREIMERLRHGATLLPAKGMYSGKDTNVLLCIIHKHQCAKLKKIVEQYPGSFAFVSSVRETYGNFKKIK